MRSKWIQYTVVLLVLVFYLLATVGRHSSDGGSAALARNLETGCWPQDIFLPLALSDYLNYFPGTQEVEPNNSYQEANGPLVSGVAYSGLFNDERDYFSIYVQAPGQITINLSSIVTENVQLQLFYQSINNRVGYDPSSPYQIVYVGQPGWYYIFIYSGNTYPTPPNNILTTTYPIPPAPTPHTPMPTPTCSPTGVGTSTFTPTPTATLPSGWYEIGTGSSSGGGISNNISSSTRPFIAIAQDNTLYVAWENDSGGNWEIYVMRWDGVGWVEVGTGSASGGGISNNTGISQHPTIAITQDNIPYIAWHDNSSGNNEIYVRRWNGSSWEEVGTGSANGGGISNNIGSSQEPTIAIAPDNSIYITWQDDSGGDSEIYVRRWNGSSWGEVGTGSANGGGVSNNSGLSEYPIIATASNNVPYIAWQDDSSGNNEIYVRLWNGNSWVEVGTNSASGGGISNNSSFSIRPTIAIAPNNTPYIAWVDYDAGGNREIYIRQWNGATWSEVGNGSASGGGISNNAGGSFSPAIATNQNNVPYIAWSDDSGGNREIYVRRWNGNSWVEVGTSSASGGGISNNAGNSYSPSLTILPGSIPYITWQDDSSSNNEIYVLRWIE